MQSYRTQATVEPDGSLTLRALPFHAGSQVEVVVLPVPDTGAEEKRYPLRGTPYRYDDPTEPVAVSDWEAAR